MIRFLFLFLSSALFLLIPPIKTKTSPPNIVWLVAEDQSPYFFPMYGDNTAALPYLSSLAEDGVVFSNAYAPVPVCAPSRSALITGMYPTSLGTHNMRTYNAYKKDNQPEIGIPSYSPIVPENVRMFTEYLRAAGYYCTNNSKEDYNFKALVSAWDESSPKAHWEKRPKDAPFFAVFNFGITHESQIWKQADQPLLTTPEEVTVPPIFPDNEVIRKDLAINYSNLQRMDAQIGKIIEQLKAEGLYENTIIFFYSDHGGPFPRHKRALYETGIKVPLIVKFESNKDAGTRNSDLISFIDYAPTVLSLAGIKPPEVMQGKAAFGPYKNPEKTEFIYTSSDRYDEVVDRLRAIRYSKFKYIRNFNPEITNALPNKYREQMAMMQNLNKLWKAGELESNAAKWFQTPKPSEELYNIEEDPYELNNLADVLALQDTLHFLRNKLDEWIVETNDLGEIPEKELVQHFLPNKEAPALDAITAEIKEDVVALKSSQNDATLVYQSPLDNVWKIYTNPLPVSENFRAKAVRIGFTDSPVFTHKTP